MPKRTRWMISLVMAFVMLFSTVGMAFATESVDSGSQPAMTSRATTPTYEQVYSTLIGLKEEYFEGRMWTNFVPYSLVPFNPYKWKGGKVTEQKVTGGVGCTALAFIFSDEAFGDLPARAYNEGQFTFDDVKVGDILRFKNDGSEHSVIVLTKSANGITVAEGNYNKSVHWGRAFSKEHVMSRTLYLITRYPVGYSEKPNPDADKPVVGEDGEKAEGSIGGLRWILTQSHALKISGTGAIPNYSPGNGNLPPWYAYKDHIYTIEITDGVTMIGDYAFYQTKNAYDVYIPDGVQDIGDGAFYGSGIMTAAIPNSVATIGNDAFRGCTGLIAATIPEGVKVIGERAFESCGGLQYIDFPASITAVGAGAFTRCTEMVRVRFVPGGGKVTMGDNMFSGCWKLNTVVLPEGADCISGGMFVSCTALASLDIPASVTEIRGYGTASGVPFAGCKMLTTINFGGSEAKWNATGGPAILTYSGLVGQVTVNFDVTFEDPFAPIPGDSGDDLISDPSEENPPVDPVHEHKWAEEWSYDNGHHWHECIAEDCPIASDEEKDGYTEHDYVGDVCACGYKHEHAWAEGWAYNETHHWHECTVAGCPVVSNDGKSGYAEHIYEEFMPSTEEIVEILVAPAADAGGGSSAGLTTGAEELILDGEHEPDVGAEDENNPGVGFSEGENPGGSVGDGTVVTPEPEAELEPSPETELQPRTEPEVTVSRICSICGHDSTQPLADPPEHQHIWSEVWSHDADNHWQKCDGCTETNGKAAHDYGGWVISVNATATQNGSKYRECNVCKYRQTESIPATDGSPSTDPNYPSYPNYPGASGTSSNTYPNTTTATTRNPDGSTTTTVISKSTGVTTETTKYPDGSQIVVETQKDGTVTTTKTDQIGNKTTTITRPDGSSIITVSQKDGTAATTTTDATGKVAAEVKLSIAAIEAAQRRGEAVGLPIPAVRTDWNVENAPVITVSTNSDEPVRVAIPVVNPAPGTVAVIVHPDGLTEVVKASVPAGESIVLPVLDGAAVKVIDNGRSFADVSVEHWAENAIAFVSARELFAGTSETTFAPEQLMTRAMLMTVLARFDGAETSGDATWYNGGMEWAMAHGISDGSDPDGDVAREQMVTMLWRYMGSPAATSTLSGFTDDDRTSGYAKEAMHWAVENGLVSGFGDGHLGSQGRATRAQVAQILQNLINNVTLGR